MVKVVSNRFRAARAALAGAAFLLLSGAATAQTVVDRWKPHEPASSYGQRFDDLFRLITILIGVAFAIVLVLLIVPVLRDRSRPGHKAVFDHGSSLHDKRFTAIVSVIVFIVLDAWVLYVAMIDLRQGFWNIPLPSEKGVVKVEVLAQQWAWNIRTPGTDGEFNTPDDIVTMNELTVPKGAPVVLNVSSKDVIHAFFLPDMRMKRDANPGAINQVWFQPIKTGTFELLCAELCGFAHYQMHGKLHVLEAEQYAAWEKEASQIATASFDANDKESHWAWDFKGALEP